MSKSESIVAVEIAGEDWRRTRDAVLNAIVGVAVVIALSGIVLARKPVPIPSRETREFARETYAALVGIVLLGYAYRRTYGSATTLREPGGLARFRKARLVAIGFATAAAGLGFAHGFYVRPTLNGVAPFWIAALALAALALPKNADLLDASLSIVESPGKGPST